MERGLWAGSGHGRVRCSRSKGPPTGLLSTSCLFPSPRLHTVSWSQAGAETEANAQLQSQSPRQHQCHVGLEAGLILLWSWARRGGRHHFSPSAPLS